MTPQRTIDIATPRHAPTAGLDGLDSFDLPSTPHPAEEGALDTGTTRRSRVALLALLVTTAAAYLYNLAASGYGNSFYAAAVEAGSKSWKAMFFGSLDASNFITVDKPPASLWIMDLSARLFGFNTWSVMVPGVLEGVIAVALLYGAVRRVTNHTVGLMAGGVLAATPVAALMFRFDNPDALLVLLLVAAAYCMTRAIEKAGTRWLVAVGALLGFAFLTKMMQAFTVVPAFSLAYLIAAPTTLRRRVGQLLAALAALVVAGGWWVAIVALTPAADRPFIDGSPDNSIVNLIFDYNGFGRLTGSGTGGGSNFSGTAGIFRLFNDLMGGQASWLLPAALIAVATVLVARRHAPRTDRVRAAAVIWGGWLLVTGAVFSYGEGVIHTYYTVALAPAIAALVAIGAYELWRERDRLWARADTALSIAVTAGWAWVLLDRTPSWNPPLRWIVLGAALLACGALAPPVWRRSGGGGRWVGLGATAVIAVACLTGPVAYAADTIVTAHTGSIPSAGPTSALGQGGGAGLPLGGTTGGGSLPSAGAGRPSGSGHGTPPSSAGAAGGSGAAGNAARGIGSSGARPSGTGSSGTGSSGTGSSGTGSSGTGATTTEGAASGPGNGFGGGGSIPSGGGGALTTSSALVKALEADASTYKWVAAVEGSQSAASLELATSGDAVMAIGGFNDEGGRLSLAGFEAYVARGEIHYYIGGSSGGGGDSPDSVISAWVKAHFKAETIGGQTVYDLTSRTSD
ncbi:MAG: glycosyltransferase family 39 protein [Acidimicrobiales bacterium]